ANRGISMDIASRTNLDATARRGRGTGIEAALRRATGTIVRHIESGARIAILSITADDDSYAAFVAGELELVLWGRGFTIVSRVELDQIRAEQQLALQGEVDDSTAARIGNLAGASVVITGGVDGTGALRRLRLRALDTTTAQVVAVVAETL
ncbi:MAG: CsgG/HfaB family protein, partial [Treponema sp.]|nr:CsgG/HfaB family protein [Treponema sp.]